MIRAVIFDMYETLITHYKSPLYFGAEMAQDAGIPKEKFYPLWRGLDYERTVGRISLEELLERILRENDCYSEALLNKLVSKRVATKEECFRHLHIEIIPMLSKLKERGLLVGLISNCYAEEAKVIRESELFPFFDGVHLSCELGIAKPDVAIFERCMKDLAVNPEKCLYIGDGGSRELETATALGMKVVQAVWYLQEGSTQLSKRLANFLQAETPREVVYYLE